MRRVLLRHSKTGLYLHKPKAGKAFWSGSLGATEFDLNEDEIVANKKTELFFALALCKNAEIELLPEKTGYEN